MLEQVYRGLYLSSFPLPEEREDPSIWKPALWGLQSPTDPTLHFLVAGTRLAEPAARAVLGFVACEYFPESRCGLVTYLAVDPAARRAGLGRRLVREAIATLVQDARRAGARLAAVFAEIHDPARVAAAGDSIAPRDRVAVMARLGAKRVPIRYVQPELHPGGRRSHSLMLVTFPLGRREQATLPATTVKSFLREFYVCLGCVRPEEDFDFARMFEGLGRPAVELDPLVEREEPAFLVDEYGVAFHFAVWRPRAGPAGPLARAPSDEIASFERDMLAYAYRDEPPFSTAVVELDEPFGRLKACFPEVLTYRSEGRRVDLAADGRRERAFFLKASRTDFASGVSILQLVLAPDATGPASCNEYDLIKLAKLWEAGEGLTRSGRDAERRRYVVFEASDGTRTTLRAIAGRLLREGERLDPARVGTIQLLSPLCERSGERPLCRTLKALVELEGAAEPTAVEIAIGGVVQGLLDFREIDADELADVFKGMGLEDELVAGFHKGTLFSIAAADRVFEAEKVRASLGVSPYLLVPHAVLLHNEVWLRHALQLVGSAGASRRLGSLERCRSEISAVLAARLVPNVFHYDEERSLYEQGRASRSLDERHDAVQASLKALETEIAARHNAVRNRASDLISILLLVLTGIQAAQKIPAALVAPVLALVALLYFWRLRF